MKKMIAIAAISIGFTLSAMEPITLPSSEVLKQRFIEQGLPERVVTMLHLHTKFGDKNMKPSDIPFCLESIYDDYTQSLSQERRASVIEHINGHKPKAVAALLQDYPDIIEKLNKQASQ